MPSRSAVLKIAQAALEVYEQLDPSLQNEVDGFLSLVIVGKAPRLENFTRELYEAYEPVRQLVQKYYGNKILLYRGEPKDKPLIKRKFLSWTPSWRLATYFAGDPDYEIVEAQVKTSDVVAVFVSPHNKMYVEYLVRDRNEYHKPSKRQVPYIGSILLGDPYEVTAEEVRRELPQVEKVLKSVGGQLIGFQEGEQEEDTRHWATVAIPPIVEIDDYHDTVKVGPYLIENLKFLVGERL